MNVQEIIKLLGKVSITTDGQWDINRRYDRLCLVYTDYQSYLSKKRVPAGIEINDERYWQPVAALKDEIKDDYKGFKLDILNALEAVNNKIKSSHLVVNTFEEFLNLTYDDVRVGAEVYVIEERITYTIDVIDQFGTYKEYHDQQDSIIGETFTNDLGRVPNVVADRAICDEFGKNIAQEYVTKEFLNDYEFGDGHALNQQQVRDEIAEALKAYTDTVNMNEIIDAKIAEAEKRIQNRVESRISALEGRCERLESRCGDLNAKIIKYHGADAI